MATCAVTPAEVAAGALSARKLRLLTEAFEADGFATLAGVIDQDALARLAPRMDADAAGIVASGGQDRGDFGNGHLQLGPPRCGPWVHASFVANEVVEQCVAAFLGGPSALIFYNGAVRTIKTG